MWSDVTGSYTLDADLVLFNERTVVLQRADHELVAIPIEQLSENDREYLKSTEAGDALRKSTDGLQTWKLRDGTQIIGRVVDYAAVDMTIQRRRGRIYVNERVLDNLPEFYQQLIPKIVAHLENLQTADRRALESWLVRQRGQARSFHLEGVVFETENGDEYAVPFFLFPDEYLKVLKPGWDEWLEVHRGDDYNAREDHAFLLRSLAAVRIATRKCSANRHDAAQTASRPSGRNFAVGSHPLPGRRPRRSAAMGGRTRPRQPASHCRCFRAESWLCRRAGARVAG